ncbi:hypothetical protein WJR50_05985, partial [Catalinimonas sp. 4WD22]|uniref:hypothetical protein n=1 Tax=Catalinimonas locisalis TaxID=3133978 RepID=UPI0031013EE6
YQVTHISTTQQQLILLRIFICNKPKGSTLGVSVALKREQDGAFQSGRRHAMSFRCIQKREVQLFKQTNI